MEPDEQTIKVLARFTEVGQWWPVGAWLYLTHAKFWARVPQHYKWHKTDELSELEANQKGIFRNVPSIRNI
jgi:hypothetical protein